MKRDIALGLLSIALVALLFAVVAEDSVAQGPKSADMGYPINLAVGQAESVCMTGTVICPATSPICDDVSVATVRLGKDGLEIVGVKPGKTLCSVQSANGIRALYAVTVR